MKGVFIDSSIAKRLFPFYLVLDNSLTVTDAGDSIKKIIPNLIDSKFSENFKFLRPGIGIKYELDSIKNFDNQIFIIQTIVNKQSFRLKGEIIAFSEKVIFVGSPWITDESDFNKLGLKLADFALHDSGIDMMQNLMVLKLSMADSRISNELLSIKNQELEKANQELDRFVYSVSHDLRAPLASLGGLLEICINEQDILSSKISPILKMMKTSILRQEMFISEILDYSLNARKELSREEVCFTELIETISEDFAFDLKSNNVKFFKDIIQPSSFFSDKRRLKIILANLVSNSLKYRDCNKHDPFVGVSIVADELTVKISVYDNGIGISSENKLKVFDMFFRGTSISDGSGLGLYIVKEVLQKLNGKIEIETELGRGCAFTIEIPNNKISN
jgi:signal transduction histidine kinase